ncbi:MAG TPA: AraC family transcriptional regulator ligand-binding domain-containing protein, partial [Polyangiales bacterium]
MASERATSRLSEAASMRVPIKPEPTATIRIVRALSEMVALAGVAQERFLRAAGLREEQLDDLNARLRYGEIARICELAMELTGDPALGLHWAETHGSHAFIPVAHLILHAATLRQGLASLAQFERLLSDEPNSRLIERDECVTLRCVPALDAASPAMRRFAADMMVASFLR